MVDRIAPEPYIPDPPRGDGEVEAYLRELQLAVARELRELRAKVNELVDNQREAKKMGELC